MEKAFRSRYVIGETGKVSQPQRFFLYQETQHCGWEKRISEHAAIIYRGTVSSLQVCIGLGKDTGLYRKRPWTDQHTIFEPMQYRQP